MDVVGRRVQEQELALGLYQRLVVLPLCVYPTEYERMLFRTGETCEGGWRS